jgi:hypothetical protein
MEGDAMSEEEAAARADLRRAAEDLEAFRFRLLGIHASLPVSPREDAMLEGEEMPDFPTEARSTLECIVNDWIAPAIRTLAELEEAPSPGGPSVPGAQKAPHSE